MYRNCYDKTNVIYFIIKHLCGDQCTTKINIGNFSSHNSSYFQTTILLACKYYVYRVYQEGITFYSNSEFIYVNTILNL